MALYTFTINDDGVFVVSDGGYREVIQGLVDITANTPVVAPTSPAISIFRSNASQPLTFRMDEIDTIEGVAAAGTLVGVLEQLNDMFISAYSGIVGGGGGGGTVVSVSGLNTDNTDPANPVVAISVDGSTITGAGTPGDPLVAAGGASYLVYTALLTQTGTDAPVATVLQNTLGGTVVWARVSDGYYTGTLAGAFPTGRTICFLTNGYLLGFLVGTVDSSPNVISVSSYVGGTPTDGQMGDASIEIRVYAAP